MGLGIGLGIQATRVSFDPAANDFFVRAGITSDTQKAAVNRLVLDLKAANIWTKMLALYPFVGGAASPHSFNLKSSSFQITWTGAVTHNSNGITGDGSTGYGETVGFAGDDTTPNNVAFGSYNRTNSDANAAEIGSNQLLIQARNTDIVFYDNAFNGGLGRTSVANTDSRGLFVSSRVGAADHRGYRNGAQLGATCVGAQGDLATLAATDWTVLAQTPAARWSARNVALAFISLGLSIAENATLYTAVQAFQTTLGRNV